MSAVVDPIRLFCLNCPPSINLSGRRSTWVPPSEDRVARTALTFGEKIAVRTYRNTLQVYDLIVSGQGEHLYRPMLDFYGQREEPDEYFRILAKFLVTSDPPLLDEPVEDLMRRLKASVERWKAQALEAARKGRA